MNKKCGGCNEIKDIIYFSKNQSQCKECKKQLAKNSRINNPEKFKNIDKINNLNKKNFVENNEKICLQCNINKKIKLFNYPYSENLICKSCIKTNKLKELQNIKEKSCSTCNQIKLIDCFSKNITKKCGYSSICKQCFSISNKKSKQKNIDKARLRDLKYKSRIEVKIRNSLRGRIRSAIINGKKHSTLIYIGCSIEECKNWLKYQFDKNMNWENYGSYWEIDHVVPCSSFDLSNDNDIYKCFSWKNIQPLEASANSSKNNKILLDLIKSHKSKVKKYIKNSM